MSKQNKKKSKNIILFIITFLLLITAIVVGIKIAEKNNYSIEIKKKMKLSFTDGISKVKNFEDENALALGWIQIQGTNIDIPVVHASILYEDTDIDYAWLNPRYIDGDNRPVILGHNILNVSSKPLLNQKGLKNFESLMSFTYSSFAKDNQYIQYNTLDESNLYVIYAIGFYDYDYDYQFTFDNKENVEKYVKSAKENSIYDYSVDVNGSDEIITIKTCTRYFGLNEKQQFIIDARKIREDEEILKYKVKKNKNYKELNINDEQVN